MGDAGRTLKNLFSLTAAEGATRLLSLITAAYLARTVGPAGYGVWGFALSVTAYFLIVVNFGLETLGTREIARDDASTRRHVDQIVTARFVNALIAYAIYAGVVTLLLDRPAMHEAVLLVVGLGLFVQAFNLEWVYRGNQRMGVIALRRVLTSGANLLGVVLLVHSPDDLIVAALVTVAATLLNILWLAVYYTRDIAPLRPGRDVGHWRRLLATSWPMATSELAMLVYYRLDIVMLGFLRPAVEVGVYYAVYNIFLVATVPANIILQAYFPRLAQARSDGGERLAVMQGYARLMFAVGVPLSATTALLAPEILGAIFGTEYANGATVLRLLMLNSIVVYINMVLGNPLLAWDRERTHMRVTLYGSGANVVLNVALIPTLGMIGAAVATLGAELVVLTALCFTHRRLTGQLYSATLLAAVVVTFGAIAAGSMLTSAFAWWWTAAAIGVLTVAGFRAIGTFRFRDLQHLFRR